MASSSSSPHFIPASLSESWTHEVFLSFRGEDTRNNFVDHLYAALVQQGIQTYKDDETLARGEQIGPALLKAIQESRIAVIVFSENYAHSSWCLDELAHIIECMETRGQIVEPIFYHVDPSDVKKLKRKYGEAFAKHVGENIHKVEKWRKALEMAGNLSGWVINDTENSYQAKCIKAIVAKVSRRLPLLHTNVNKDLIGMETRFQVLKSKLKIGSGGVRMVGIWGLGGGGKTTLASAAYMEISRQFEACCLLENVREESSKHGLTKLQEKLLSLTLKTNVVVGSEIEGRSMIKRRLCHKRILVVLDDLSDLKQLEALAGSHDWFGKGSRIIITTRDEHLLTRKIDAIYEVSLLSHDEAIKLFGRHAYREDNPVEDYETLSVDVVSYAGGLPLALKVIGSFLYDKDKDAWMNALAKLKHIPFHEVTKILKISYDGLEPDQQKLFLDIACCFRGDAKSEAMMVLNACNLYPGSGVTVLEQKSLIKVSDGIFDMHDLVEEMAHYIVRGEHPFNLEKQSRIWEEEDIKELCVLGAAAPDIEVLALPTLFYNYPAAAEMKRLNFRFDHPHLHDVFANMKKLRCFKWQCYPASSFPSNFQPTKLGYLELRNSLLKELWKGYKYLPNLKVLDLAGSSCLIRTPDFEGLPFLERLNLKFCSELKEIHPSFGYHERLAYVNMELCSKLKNFPPIMRMNKLESLLLSGCRSLEKVPDIHTNIDSLLNLSLRGTGIEIIPATVGKFCTNLVSLDIGFCKLKRIEGNLHLLKSLEVLKLQEGREVLSQLPSFHQFQRSLRELDLSQCNLRDGDIPSDICELLNLQVLDLGGNNFSRLHSSLSRIPGLKYLDLSHCESLVELPDLPSSIAILKANWCSSLESVGDLSDYKWLWKVSFMRCRKLIGGERIVGSMLQGNAFEDRFMSFLLPDGLPSTTSFCKKLHTLQLPHNWYSDFSGFLLCAEDYFSSIVIKLEKCMDSQPADDQWEKFDKNWEPNGYEMVGYVPFVSLRHTSWWNSTHTNISFQFRCMDNLKAVLVPRKIKTGDSTERAVDCSENWDEEYEHKKTFKIIDDSRSSSIHIEWNHSKY